MQLILSNLVTAISNFLVFAAIPFIWWLIKHRKKVPFFAWVGLKKPELKSKWWVLIVFVAVYAFVYNFDWISLVKSDAMSVIENNDSIAANVFDGIGVAAIIPAFIQNFFANGLSEELLYRGFLNKRLCNKFGTIPGTVMQAVLFALMHNGLYLLTGVPVGLDFHVIMFVFTGGVALLLGYLDEKIFNGSIIPSILVHGLGNFITSMIVAFGLR